MAAFPDLHITIDYIITDGNNVVILTNTTGTPAQPLTYAAGVPISRKRTLGYNRKRKNAAEPWIDQVHEPKNFAYK